MRFELQIILIFAFFVFLFKKDLFTLNQVVRVECNGTGFGEIGKCFAKYSIPALFLNQTTFDLRIPSRNQRKSLINLVQKLLNQTQNCSIEIPFSLKEIYQIQSISLLQKNYCVLSEIYTGNDGPYFAKGWGTFIVDLSHSNNIHFAAPHPLFDYGTVQQASYLFESVGAKSLLLAGTHRKAFDFPSNCIQGHNNGISDPTHNKDDPFNIISIAIADWQLEKLNSKSEFVFVQFHGKSPSTCLSDDVFLSTGLGFHNQWYINHNLAPINKIRSSLNSRGIVANSPETSDCMLVATTNVFGRYLNGVKYNETCFVAATAESTNGYFVHIEQSPRIVHSSFYDMWTHVLKESLII